MAGNAAPAGEAGIDAARAELHERHEFPGPCTNPEGPGVTGGGSDQRAMTTVPDTTDRSFETAYDRLRPTLVRVAYLLTSDVQEASDLVQDAFEAALPRWDRIDDHAAYLRRAVTNRAYNATRDRTRRADKAHRAGQDAARAGAPEHEYLGDLIAALPPPQRAVVVLRFHLDLPYDEIARCLGIRPGSVGPTLQRALRALDQELAR